MDKFIAFFFLFSHLKNLEAHLIPQKMKLYVILEFYEICKGKNFHNVKNKAYLVNI